MKKEIKNNEPTFIKCWDSLLIELGAYEALVYEIIFKWLSNPNPQPFFVGNEKIGKRIGKSGRSVQRILKTLEKAGYISIEIMPNENNKTKRQIILTNKRPKKMIFDKFDIVGSETLDIKSPERADSEKPKQEKPQRRFSSLGTGLLGCFCDTCGEETPMFKDTSENDRLLCRKCKVKVENNI